ncbi:MAG: DUF58 domain-containing protein [Caldilineaceae bacterium]
MHAIFWSLLILFLIATLFRLDWVYYLVYVVGGIWIFSHWWIRRSFRKLSIHRKMVHNAFVGEKLPVHLIIENHSWLPFPWLLVEERVPLDLKDALEYRNVLAVGGRSVVDHQYLLYCKRRGYYAVGPLNLSTGDLFGFTGANWEEDRPTYVTVYPQVVPLHELGLPSRSPFGVLPARQRLFEDPNRMTGVREYMSGDSQRRIHWKASAHEDTLLVKKFQPAIALNVAIVLDLNSRNYPISSAIGSSEWGIIVAASLASYVSEQRQPVGMITNGLDAPTNEMTMPIPSRQGQGHLITILTALARVQMHDVDASLSEWLPRQIAELEWGTTLIVVTPHLTIDDVWVLHNAYRRGSRVLAMVCATQPDLDAVRAQAEKLNVFVHQTIWERDLHRLSQAGQKTFRESTLG